MLQLAERMRARRALPRADSGLSSYQAHASGYVYFYLDREGSPERTLVKVDQVALEVYWAAPDFTKQRIVGLREESRLPNRMRYHLDHLTVVQDEFGDVIRMGDGDEVRAVPHPAAPGAEAVYQFRMADSLSLYLPGAPDPVRVYELEVRPRRFDRPGFIGSVFVDRATAAIVRMAFTFTPASYVDPRLDYIHVALDNGLWEGRYWLPHEQRVEIRRQIPQLEFAAGAVIRGVYRIGDYRFDTFVPEGFFRGGPVVAAPTALREAYPFREGLFDGLGDEGLERPADLETLRRQALEMVGQRYLSGLPRLRVHVPSASSALRFNRAEGLHLGAGVTYEAGTSLRLDVSGGYATGPDHPSVDGSVRYRLGERTSARAGLYHNALRDLGVRAGAAGILNTAAAATMGEDYLDPYFASGARLEVDRRLSHSWRAAASLRFEEHRSARLTHAAAPLDGSAVFRPILPVQEGSLTELGLSLRHAGPAASIDEWRGDLSMAGGELGSANYGLATARFTANWKTADRDAVIEVGAAGGAAFGDVPPQRIFLIGGRSTLPGYRYRAFGGDRFMLAEAVASHELVSPWVRLRGLAALGWTAFAATQPPIGWAAAPTDGIRASIGLGLGLLYDVFRLDVVRGLNGGEWQALFSIDPKFWDFL